MIMQKLKRVIAKLFIVNYRLTSFENGRYVNRYSDNGKLLFAMAKNLKNAEYWTLYKKGPFGIAEREIDRGSKNEKGENQ